MGSQDEPVVGAQGVEWYAGVAGREEGPEGGSGRSCALIRVVEEGPNGCGR